jgi:cell division protein FtsN
LKISVQQERNIRTFGCHIALLLALFLWTGCSSSDSVTEELPSQSEEQTDTSMAPAQPAPVKVIPQQKPRPKPSAKRNGQQSSAQRFSVQADTVVVQQKKKPGSQSSSISVKASTPKKFYTVEIGAFRRQSNVDRHRTQLAERFHLPVRVLFDSSISLTRVCVGTFSTRSLAIDFMKKMQSQYPEDYPDCWVSYWTK